MHESEPTNRQISRQMLLEALTIVAEQSLSDPEAAHVEADQLLIEYINDPLIAHVYAGIRKWYA